MLSANSLTEVLRQRIVNKATPRRMNANEPNVLRAALNERRDAKGNSYASKLSTPSSSCFRRQHDAVSKLDESPGRAKTWMTQQSGSCRANRSVQPEQVCDQPKSRLQGMTKKGEGALQIGSYKSVRFRNARNFWRILLSRGDGLQESVLWRQSERRIEAP